jgi:diacylglycerol kinase (ATP)
VYEAESVSRASRVFAILNPAAGGFDADQINKALIEHFVTEERELEVYQMDIDGQENLSQIARDALDGGFDIVVTAGGDGTVSGVIGGLAGTKHPLGILPVGTVNTLARDLDIPLHLDQALALLTGDHKIKCVDLMQVGDRFFVLNVSVGISSLTMVNTEQAAKRRFGQAAYLRQGLKWLTGFQPQRFRVTVDGQSSQWRASEVVAANSGLLGMAPLRWGPQVHLDDGQLDVCIVYARTVPGYFRLIWEAMTGRQRQDPKVHYMRAEHSVAINTDYPLPVQGDGEYLGETPVRVQVVPNALRVVVPPE